MVNRTTFAFALPLFIIMALSSCNKDNQPVVNGVPFVAVNVLINTNNPAYFDIQVPGGWVYHAAGSRGLIIYRRSQDVFVAMDRHCPFRPQDGCQVNMDQSAVFSEDTGCCSSQFGVNDGSILQGPAVQTFDGTFLRIFN